MVYEQTMIHLSTTPYYEKDSAGNKTDKLKGYIIELLETSQDKDANLKISSVKYFPRVDMVDDEVIAELSPFCLVSVQFNIQSATSAPKFSGIKLASIEDVKVGVEFTVKIPQV